MIDIPYVQSQYLVALLVLVLSLVIAKLVFFIFENVLLKITKKTKTDIDDKIIASLHGPIYYSIIFAGVLAALSFAGLSERIMYYVTNLVKTLLVLVWAIAVARVTTIVSEDVRHRIVKKTGSDLADTLLPFLDKVVRVSILVIGLLIILDMWRINITPILASAGIAGIAIGFAAKHTLSNFFGGISLFLDRPYKVNDIIQLDSADRGEVIEIGIRSTKLRTFDNTLITIPNSVIANSRILNLSAPHPRIKLKVPIGVAYGSDVNKVEKILLNIAKKTEDVLEDPEPVVRFREFGDSSLNFVLTCWVANPLERIKTLDQINKEIYKRFNKEGVEIPFPQRDVHMKKY